MFKLHGTFLTLVHWLVLACLAIASHAGGQHTSIDLMQRKQQAQSREFKTAKDVVGRKRSAKSFLGLGPRGRNSMQSLKALLLLWFSRSVMPQTFSATTYLARQTLARRDAKMTELSATVADLETQLAVAVEREDYATAAKLRDELKAARGANPLTTLLWERKKKLKEMLTNALSEEASLAIRTQAVEAIAEMAFPPMPAEGAEDALHQILVETDGDIQAEAESALADVWCKSGDEKIDSLFQQGVQYMHEQSFQEAIDTFTAVIEKAPDFAEGWNRRATCYYFMREIDRAIEDCNQVLKLKPRHFRSLWGRGACLIRQRELADGVRFLKTAVKVNPRYARLQRGISTIEELARVQQEQRMAKSPPDRQGIMSLRRVFSFYIPFFVTWNLVWLLNFSDSYPWFFPFLFAPDSV